jgi:hypothetical protein
MVLEELLDSNFDPPVVYDVVYSVRRRKEIPDAPETGLPKALGARINARSAGLNTGGFSIAWIAD